MPIIVTPTFTPAAGANFSYIDNASTELGARGTSLQLNLPSYQSGDILIAFLASNGYTVSTPSGWTKRVTPSSSGIHVYTKVAGASETKPTFTYGGSDIHVGNIVSVRGAVYVAAGCVTDVAIPSITSVANGLVFAMTYDYHASANSSPVATRDFAGSGWSELVDTTSTINDTYNNFNHWGIYGKVTTGTASGASGTITDSGESLSYYIGVASVGPG